jgi:DNA-binding NarL/FixJ family response regulator
MQASSWKRSPERAQRYPCPRHWPEYHNNRGYFQIQVHLIFNSVFSNCILKVWPVSAPHEVFRARLPHSKMRPRLLIADDHTLLLDGLRVMLEPEFELAGVVGDGHALLAAAAKLKPDLILLDIAMPVLNGIDAARQLRKIVPLSKLIFLTMHGDPDYVTEAFRIGASGYLLKRAAASELITAIHEVLKGHRYVSPLVGADRQELMRAASQPGSSFSDRLTVRQREVLQLVAEGRTRKEIAAILKISVKTVEFHKARLSRGFHLRTTADFTKYAIEHGLIDTNQS